MRPPSSFLVVRVRLSDWRRGLFFALPLFVLEDALESLAILARGVLWVGRRLDGAAPNRTWGLLEKFVHVPAAAISALRSCGRLTLADVRDDETHVSVWIV